MRTLAQDVPNQLDREIEVSGWVHRIRELGQVNFVLPPATAVELAQITVTAAFGATAAASVDIAAPQPRARLWPSTGVRSTVGGLGAPVRFCGRAA